MSHGYHDYIGKISAEFKNVHGSYKIFSASTKYLVTIILYTIYYIYYSVSYIYADKRVLNQNY